MENTQSNNEDEYKEEVSKLLDTLASSRGDFKKQIDSITRDMTMTQQTHHRKIMRLMSEKQVFEEEASKWRKLYKEVASERESVLDKVIDSLDCLRGELDIDDEEEYFYIKKSTNVADKIYSTHQRSHSRLKQRSKERESSSHLNTNNNNNNNHNNSNVNNNNNINSHSPSNTDYNHYDYSTNDRHSTNNSNNRDNSRSNRNKKKQNKHRSNNNNNNNNTNNNTNNSNHNESNYTNYNNGTHNSHSNYSNYSNYGNSYSNYSSHTSGIVGSNSRNRGNNNNHSHSSHSSARQGSDQLSVYNSRRNMKSGHTQGSSFMSKGSKKGAM